jgi:hypothetical protein
MYSAQARCRQEKPGTGADKVLGRSSATRVHLGEFTLSTGQPLFGGSPQPYHGLGSVTFDGIAVVIQTTVIEDTEIKLRRGVAAFGCEKQVLYRAALHQSIQTTGRDGRRFQTPRTPSARSAAIVEPRAMDRASRFTRQLPQVLPHGAEKIKLQ